MAEKTLLKKTGDAILDNWKFILGTGSVLAVTYVGWNIYKDLRDKPDDSNLGQEFTPNPKLPPASITEAQAVMIANRLQEEMGTFGSSSDEEVENIKALLTGLTYNDYVAVSKAFGERGYITLTGISKDSDWLAPKKPLSYWLSKELSSKDLDALKMILPGIF